MIGLRLEALRKEAGLSQAGLALKLGVSQSSIGYYESESKDPGTDVLLRYCKYFHVSADYLLGLSDNRFCNDSYINRTAIPAYTAFKIRSQLAAIVEELTTILEE